MQRTLLWFLCSCFLNTRLHLHVFWLVFFVVVMFSSQCLETCLYCCIFLFFLILFSCCHPSISCSFRLFPLSPWHPNLQSEFILSPHQSHGREGAVSSASVSSSLLLSHSPPCMCIAPSHPPAKALMLQKVLQKKFFSLFLHPSIFPLVIFSFSLSADGVISKWIICITLFRSLSFSRFKISSPLLDCT